MTNKLEELEKKVKKANEAYETAYKAFYLPENTLYSDCDCYFSIAKKRKELENNYINARDNLKAANKAYDIESTKQKQWRNLLYLEYKIKELTKYKTSLTLEGLKKLEELENEMRKIYEVYFSTSEYKTVDKDAIRRENLDNTTLKKKLEKEANSLRELMEIADGRCRDAWETWIRTEDEYDKNIADSAEMEYTNAWEAWVSALDAKRAYNNELNKNNDK